MYAMPVQVLSGHVCVWGLKEQPLRKFHGRFIHFEFVQTKRHESDVILCEQCFEYWTGKLFHLNKEWIHASFVHEKWKIVFETETEMERKLFEKFVQTFNAIKQYKGHMHI